MIKKVPLLPNFITAFGLSCGLFALFKMSLSTYPDISENFLIGITGIWLLAAFADILDGAVARILKAQSDFGGLFDSLADSISFGVAPAVIAIKSLPISWAGKMPLLIMSGAMVYCVCGVLRLVRFNLLSNQAKDDLELASAQKKHFTGLPIPAAAAALISINLILVSDDLKVLFNPSDTLRLCILFAAMVVLGYFMISRWKFPSVKTLRIPVASFEVVFLTVLSTVLLFYGLINHFAVLFFVIAWGYLIIAWTLSIIRLIAGKKSKTLEEFEPDNDFEEE